MDSAVVVGSAIGAAVGVVAGVPISLLGQQYFVSATRERKELGYKTLSANVIIPRMRVPSPHVRLTVMKSLLDPDAAADEFVDVEEVYGFRIEIRNSGNVELLNQPVTFQFPIETKIILADFEDAPEFGASPPMMSIDNQSSRVTINFPFLNDGDRVIVSIQTVHNANFSYKTLASAPGLRTVNIADESSRRTRSVGVVVSLLTALTISILFGLSFSGWFHGDTPSNLRFAAGLFATLLTGIVLNLAVLRAAAARADELFRSSASRRRSQ